MVTLATASDFKDLGSAPMRSASTRSPLRSRAMTGKGDVAPIMDLLADLDQMIRDTGADETPRGLAMMRANTISASTRAQREKEERQEDQEDAQLALGPSIAEILEREPEATRGYLAKLSLS
ncbi:hypothetical protein HK101_005534 [Irineochytrium annulatum]|nr:hypothetical protein HK101_005534 [Irineochytrium annulatum]